MRLNSIAIEVFLNVPHSFKADLLLVLVTLIAAFGWVFSKEALAGLPPLLFLAVRFILAGLVLSIAVGGRWRRLNLVQLGLALKVGVVMSVAMMFWVLGLNSSTHLGESAFINSLAFILVPLLVRGLFGETQPLFTWLALPVALLGLGLLTLKGSLQLEHSQLLFMVAATLFALHICLITRLSGKVPVLALSAIQLLMVGLFALLASIVFETWPSRVSNEIWGWVLVSALIATSLRFLLQIYAQGLTSASHAALILTLEPVFTALLASVWFAERMSLAQLLGCVLVFAAMMISRTPALLMALKNVKRLRRQR
ncbi:DMT family transporter [Aestuariirhabdus sp. Z084]|uniref:DMT family transporter n=1 Tax=Aestuariirhabdus haliotis TaxID=2918751 RepID=UPI00201B416B|nr:DMT family transporter [Aestuariirhabdus haliotis]MCL6417288.1 DMT family transporter [Aestuariirhabdus haliotis]MCL6421233.1 DMT family transporter [Aestuariirhabdus haliotis]